MGELNVGSPPRGHRAEARAAPGEAGGELNVGSPLRGPVLFPSWVAETFREKQECVRKVS